MADQKDCPLQFSEFKEIDHCKTCPRYSSVLGRPDEEGIAVEEIDTLQLELETLLAAVSLRMQQLHTETQVLQDWQDKKDGKKTGKPFGKEESSPGKRGRVDEKLEKPMKKVKESGKLGVPMPSGPGRPKAKNIQQKLQEYEFIDEPLEIPRVPRNDVPDRFWTSVEPYCGDITTEHMKTLHELIQAHENDAEYFKVPPLGRHYSTRWAQEDLLEEQKEGGRIAEKKKSLSGNTTPSQGREVKGMLKRVEALRERESDVCPFGPLTQRLISALVDENIMMPIEDIIMETNKVETPVEAKESPKQNNRPFSVPHTRALEARIREELFNQGLLDFDDKASEGEEDEVLGELQKRQAELRALCDRNQSQKQRLYKLAKDQMKRQELRQKMRGADNEVLECFRRLMAARQKKRSPTKKERDQAARALRDRDAAVRQLEAMGPEFYSC
ncbi:transcriptional adapter 3-like [Antedon mediterranea]|uniref:transcriptional adapter 3-like n=1 Tax=Antedon mediterranea TaxID=105859 RepID=UPI003AF87241